MASIIIREYRDIRRTRNGDDGVFVDLTLVTDVEGLPIKTVTAAPGVPIDCPQLSASTLHVELESDADVRFALRPKGAVAAVPATVQHNLLKAATPTMIGVRQGSIISFLA